MEKIKVLKCEECNRNHSCYVFTVNRECSISFDSFECDFYPYQCNWKETNDYEIVEKGIEVTDQEKHIHIGNESRTNKSFFIQYGSEKHEIPVYDGEGVDDIQKRIDAIPKPDNNWNVELFNKTPNCSVCRWLVLEKTYYSQNGYCSACGYKSAPSSHLSDGCKQLFEEKLPSIGDAL